MPPFVPPVKIFCLIATITYQTDYSPFTFSIRTKLKLNYQVGSFAIFRGTQILEQNYPRHSIFPVKKIYGKTMHTVHVSFLSFNINKLIMNHSLRDYAPLCTFHESLESLTQKNSTSGFSVFCPGGVRPPLVKVMPILEILSGDQEVDIATLTYTGISNGIRSLSRDNRDAMLLLGQSAYTKKTTAFTVYVRPCGSSDGRRRSCPMYYCVLCA